MGAWEKKREAARKRKELRERAVAYLGGSCRICGYDKCTSALDFHHLNSLAKDFTISARMTSWKAIEKELTKCILICANCHREVHDGLHNGYLEDETSRGDGVDELDLSDLAVDPTVTPEDIRKAMETETELSKSFSVRPTFLDMLVELD